jgi:hypothetical protein
MTEEIKFNEVKPHRIVIQSKGVGARYERQFFMDIQNAILNGYRIADNDSRADVSMRMFRGRFGRAVLYLQEDKIEIEDIITEAETEEVELKTSPDLIEKIEKTDSHKDLKELAKENNLEAPSNLRNPKALKKNLLEQLQAQE